jgi:hypothetical protein
MGTPYFNRDESIILTAHKVKFDSVLSDVMLTSQRIILIDAGYAQFKPQIIPLAAIETVIPGEDAYGNPIVTLSLAATTPDGATQTKELVFSRLAGSDRKQESNDWVKHLREQIKSVREKASAMGGTPAELDTDIIFDDTIGTETDRIPESTGGSTVTVTPSTAQQPAGQSGTAPPAEPPKVPLSSRFHPQPPTPSKRSYSSIAAIIIVILAVTGIAIMYTGILQGTPHESPVTTTPPVTPAVTTTTPPVTTTIPPSLVTTPVITPEPTTTLPPVIIPGTGVWVRVQYEGDFIGQVGLSGAMRDVKGSSDRFFQISTVDGIVIATIQKEGGSGDPLTVDVYRNGTVVKSGSTTAPRGTVDLHVDLKTV